MRAQAKPEKTISILFTRRRKILTDGELPKLYLEGRELKREYTTKYLGITLDHKLSWSDHINGKITKAKQYMGACRTSLGGIWGPKPQFIKWLYTGVIRPALTCGSLVWGHRLTAVQTRKLTSLQRSALMQMGLLRKGTWLRTPCLSISTSRRWQ